ncbi:MAG: hypothetical protein ABIO04_01140 [Ferruginibacter sp.]
MDDRFGKYLRLFGTLFFSLIGLILALILILLGIKFLFGLVSNVTWITYAYMIFILLIPAALFIACYIVYFKRTSTHPNTAVRWISYTIFSLALISWITFICLDAVTFYKHTYTAIGMYRSYDMIFLAINVAIFFIVGVIQALTTKKEVDWMDRTSLK